MREKLSNPKVLSLLIVAAVVVIVLLAVWVQAMNTSQVTEDVSVAGTCGSAALNYPPNVLPEKYRFFNEICGANPPTGVHFGIFENDIQGPPWLPTLRFVFEDLALKADIHSSVGFMHTGTMTQFYMVCFTDTEVCDSKLVQKGPQFTKGTDPVPGSGEPIYFCGFTDANPCPKGARGDYDLPAGSGPGDNVPPINGITDGGTGTGGSGTGGTGGGTGTGGTGTGGTGTGGTGGGSACGAKDYNNDGKIDLADLSDFVKYYNKSCSD